MDAGTLDWDDPVSKWLPYFAVADPLANQSFAIRDLLTHHSGLERGDMLWATGRYDRKGVVSHLRYLRQIQVTYSQDYIAGTLARHGAIVADLVELYGGSIALGSSPLGGLRATLRLPSA